jgi:hypothetical protein
MGSMQFLIRILFHLQKTKICFYTLPTGFILPKETELGQGEEEILPCLWSFMPSTPFFYTNPFL